MNNLYNIIAVIKVPEFSSKSLRCNLLDSLRQNLNNRTLSCMVDPFGDISD